MLRVFLGLAVSDAVLLGFAGFLGWTVQEREHLPLHILMGMLGSLFTCLVHCVAFTYFVATEKMIKLAVLNARLDADYIATADKLKYRALACAGTSIIAIIFAAALGAATMTELIVGAWHLSATLVAVALNLTAFGIESATIQANSRLMDRVYSEHNAAAAAQAESEVSDDGQ
jgi:hypothetical protein